MAEVLARKPDGIATTAINWEKTIRLGKGAEGEVSRVNVVVPGNQNRTRELTLAYKQLTNPTVWTRGMIERYKMVRSAGLPTFTTFRSAGYRAGVLMTDLTENDKNVVLSCNDVNYPEFREGLMSQRQEQMEGFRRVLQNSTGLVREKCEEFADTASAAKLRLPYDSWFIVIGPDGRFRFVVGDFGGVDISKEKDMDRLKGKNTRDFWNFFNGVKKVLTL